MSTTIAAVNDDHDNLIRWAQEKIDEIELNVDEKCLVDYENCEGDPWRNNSIDLVTMLKSLHPELK